MRAKPPNWVDQSIRESLTDIVRQTFVELCFSVVNREIPVPAALIEVILSLEKRASDIQLSSERSVRGPNDAVGDTYQLTSLRNEAADRA